MLMAKARLGNWADRVTGEGGMGKGKKTEKKGNRERRKKVRNELHFTVSLDLSIFFPVPPVS
jgi:hypothetical protein